MYKKPKGGKRVVREAAVRYGTPLHPSSEISAADFKTHCLRLIEEVRQGRGEVVITRYGKPVAKLVPFEEDAPVSLFGYLSGSVVSHGDLISPIDEDWDADA